MKTFNQFQENAASVTIKQGSKLIPALMTGVGAVGTYLQSRKKKAENNQGPGLKPGSGTKPGGKWDKLPKGKNSNWSDNNLTGIAKQVKKQQNKAKLIKKIEDLYGPIPEETKTGGTIKKPTVNINGKEMPGLGGGGGGTNAITMKSKSKTTGKRLKDTAKLVTTPFRAVLGIKSKQDPKEKFASEEVMAGGPTNNVGGGQIAGTVEAGDDPPVKKKKRYIYGGKGSRKMWMP